MKAKYKSNESLGGMSKLIDDAYESEKKKELPKQSYGQIPSDALSKINASQKKELPKQSYRRIPSDARAKMNQHKQSSTISKPKNTVHSNTSTSSKTAKSTNVGTTTSKVTQVKKSPTVLQNSTHQNIQQVPTYQGTYEQQMQQILSDIMNQKSFTYDPATDKAYQKYAEMYKQNADKAMQDSMANAVSLTGGYGNSYASSVGQQAYNNEIANLDQISLQLRDQAYNQYLDSINQKYNQFNVVGNMADREYQQYQDALNQYNYNDERDYNRGIDQRNFDYQKERDKVADSQWNQNFAYQKYRDSVSDSLSRQRITNSTSKKTSSTGKEDDFTKGTKAYNTLKGELAQKISTMVSTRDDFNNRVYDDDYLCSWIENMAVNADMAQDLLQAYGLWDYWYQKNYGTKNQKQNDVVGIGLPKLFGIQIPNLSGPE